MTKTSRLSRIGLRAFVATAVSALALVLLAPGLVQAQTPMPLTDRVPAPIEQVSVEQRNGRWVAVVTSGLPNGCASFDSISARQSSIYEFDVTVMNRNTMPPGGACTMVYGYTTNTVDLAGTLNPGTYRVVVNRGEPTSKETTFTVGPDTQPVVFVPAPRYSAAGLAQVVFPGGTVATLEASAKAAGAAGVWVQDVRGVFHLLVVNAPPFVTASFAAAFAPPSGPTNFTGQIAVTLVKA